jgi:hypothetical protein
VRYQPNLKFETQNNILGQEMFVADHKNHRVILTTRSSTATQ